MGLLLCLLLPSMRGGAQDVTTSEQTVTENTLTETNVGMADEETAEADTVGLNHMPEDFVQTSILIASPGERLYTVLGHAVIRMQCPTHGLDFVFSYESEDATSHVMRYLMGRLKMGVRMVPTQQYVDLYRAEERSVVEYALTLPIQVKQNLWRLLDEDEAQLDVAYDYLKHGCALSVLQWLQRATNDQIDFAPWGDLQEKPRKEVACGAMKNRWHRFVFSTVVGGDAHEVDIDPTLKVVVPSQLVELLQHSKAYGKTLLGDAPVTLYEGKDHSAQTPFSPCLVGLLLLALALLNIRLHSPTLRYTLLGMQTLAGLLFVYLICLSDLPCTQWNWLIIPFNPLPLLLWKWRRQVAYPLAGIVAVWAVGMWLSPHYMVETAHIIMGIAVALTILELRHEDRHS